MESIGKSVPEYLHAHEQDGKDVYWPVKQSRILFENGFATASGKAQLQGVGDGPMYRSMGENVLIIEDAVEDAI